jgi:hypothetical protein
MIPGEIKHTIKGRTTLLKHSQKSENSFAFIFMSFLAETKSSNTKKKKTNSTETI